LLVLIAVSFIDIDYKIIPNKIIIPALVVFSLLVPLQYFSGVRLLNLLTNNWYDPLIGFFIGGGFLFLLALIWPGGMGGGDIKLMAFVGLFLGSYTVVALFIGFLLGALGGVLAMLFLGKSRKDQIPFGPYLALGALFTLFFGQPLINWYFSLF
jgi:leader peptidase (prepilin peptidase)/N-methyltransferase